MTYGALRARLQKLSGGLDLELIDGWIQDRYAEALDKIPWKRLQSSYVFQVPDSVNAGTVTVTAGSATVTGSGTAWTDSLDGFMFRLPGQEEFYQFTYVSATSGTLDRVYERDTEAGLTYRIDQTLFVMPALARTIESVRPVSGKPLERVTTGQMDSLAGNRGQYGTPRWWAPTWDNFSDPPRLQIELYPITDGPDTLGRMPSFAADLVVDASEIDPEATGESLLPFMRPQMLIAGVQSDIAAHKGNFQGSQLFEGRWNEMLADAILINAQHTGPIRMKMNPRYGIQRRGGFRRGPVHEGFTG